MGAERRSFLIFHWWFTTYYPHSTHNCNAVTSQFLLENFGCTLGKLQTFQVLFTHTISKLIYVDTKHFYPWLGWANIGCFFFLYYASSVKIIIWLQLWVSKNETIQWPQWSPKSVSKVKRRQYWSLNWCLPLVFFAAYPRFLAGAHPENSYAHEPNKLRPGIRRFVCALFSVLHCYLEPKRHQSQGKILLHSHFTLVIGASEASSPSKILNKTIQPEEFWPDKPIDLLKIFLARFARQSFLRVK